MRVQSGRAVTGGGGGSSGVNRFLDSQDVDSCEGGILVTTSPKHPLNPLKGERAAAGQVAGELLIGVICWHKGGAGDGVENLHGV
jgi:hypothetical protein